MQHLNCVILTLIICTQYLCTRFCEQNLYLPVPSIFRFFDHLLDCFCCGSVKSFSALKKKMFVYLFFWQVYVSLFITLLDFCLCCWASNLSFLLYCKQDYTYRSTLNCTQHKQTLQELCRIVAIRCQVSAVVCIHHYIRSLHAVKVHDVKYNR